MQLNNERSRGVILENTDVVSSATAGVLNISLLIDTLRVVTGCFTYKWL